MSQPYNDAMAAEIQKITEMSSIRFLEPLKLLAFRTNILPLSAKSIFVNDLHSLITVRTKANTVSLITCFFSFILKILDPFRQTKPHFDPTPYSDNRTPNFLKVSQNIKEFHVNGPIVCVDRFVGGLLSLCRTAFFLSFIMGENK